VTEFSDLWAWILRFHSIRFSPFCDRSFFRSNLLILLKNLHFSLSSFRHVLYVLLAPIFIQGVFRKCFGSEPRFSEPESSSRTPGLLVLTDLLSPPLLFHSELPTPVREKYHLLHRCSSRALWIFVRIFFWPEVKKQQVFPRTIFICNFTPFFVLIQWLPPWIGPLPCLVFWQRLHFFFCELALVCRSS